MKGGQQARGLCSLQPRAGRLHPVGGGNKVLGANSATAPTRSASSVDSRTEAGGYPSTGLPSSGQCLLHECFLPTTLSTPVSFSPFLFALLPDGQTNVAWLAAWSVELPPEQVLQSFPSLCCPPPMGVRRLYIGKRGEGGLVGTQACDPDWVLELHLPH